MSINLLAAQTSRLLLVDRCLWLFEQATSVEPPCPACQVLIGKPFRIDPSGLPHTYPSVAPRYLRNMSHCMLYVPGIE